MGFNGAKIFCMHNLTMSPIDVPQSASLYRYLEDRNFDKSYQVACLGVTESDWRLLAMEALRQMRLDYARRAFIRVRDMRYIELLNQIEIARRGRSNKDKWKVVEGKVAALNILSHKAKDMASLVNKVEARDKLPSQDQVFLGHILAYQSRFTDAARVFEKAGKNNTRVVLKSHSTLLEDLYPLLVKTDTLFSFFLCVICRIGGFGN